MGKILVMFKCAHRDGMLVAVKGLSSFRIDFVPNRGNVQYEGEYKPHPEWYSSPNLLYITEGHSASACYRTFGIPRGFLGKPMAVHER